MAPYLLFGFFIAGVLHVTFTRDLIYRHMSGNRFGAIVKASAFGVPLPLCSCGVIPVAAHLDKQGAGKAPVVSFLVSTPTTGIDSIAATYGLMGPLLAVARPVAALAGGLLTGAWVRMGIKEEVAMAPAAPAAKSAASGDEGNIVSRIFHYGFIELLSDTSKWLIIGIALGGLISYALPQQWIETYLSNAWLAYPLMLLIGIPMYVCATGSIPVAASLMMKGMSPGAGFIFLMAGPATNTATISFIAGKLGKKTLFIYLASIALTSVLFGLLIDWVWHWGGSQQSWVHGQMEMLPSWLENGSAALLLSLLAWVQLKGFVMSTEGKDLSGKGLLLSIPDMTCKHCVATIETALKSIDGVDDIEINLENHQVLVTGKPDSDAVSKAVVEAGYTLESSRANQA
ncbi:MAG: SO_0444 family Cu/Zn efflux transporter [Calditrichaeota bacterium]|nr:SO_0444 family Cu/Zn efflux transporter [Calditrichota bacterium]